MYCYWFVQTVYTKCWMKLYRWIAMHRVHSSPLYIEQFCRSAYQSFSHRCKCSCGCVRVGRWGEYVSIYVRYVCTYVHVQKNLEKLDSRCRGCKLYTSHSTHQKLAYRCLDVDIHYGGLFMSIHIMRSDMNLPYHMTAIWTTFWQSLQSAWDTYIHIIYVHQVDYIPSGQAIPDHSFLFLAVCEQLCWLTAPLNEILNKCHKWRQFSDVATSFCVWNQTAEQTGVFPCLWVCSMYALDLGIEIVSLV